MPADDKETGDRLPASIRATLARIAKTLGCSVEAFTDDTPDPLNTRGLSELLTIWTEMDDDGDRERLLGFARQLARA